MADKQIKRATEDIFVAPGVRAYRKGSVVPESAIKNLDIAGKVAGDGTKAADAAVADAAGDDKAAPKK